MSAAPRDRTAKCVVWDLDHTLWSGVLLEDGEVTLRAGVREIIDELDRRGILQSIASKNDHATAMAKVEALGLAEYFLYPQIHWGTKSESIQRIADALNIGVDTFVFVDDQPFERAEVESSLPKVRCYDGSRELGFLLAEPSLSPPVVTEEGRARRVRYLEDARRQQAEERFDGPKEAFLRSLDLRFTIRHATAGDLARAEELTVRTSQLNTTGVVFSAAELESLCTDPGHLVVVAELSDVFGSYGVIGLAVVALEQRRWLLQLLLMSCRVMSRGVGAVLMGWLLHMAKAHGGQLQARFRPTERNRMMLVTLRFGGFAEVESHDDELLLAHSMSNVPALPEHVTLEAPMTLSRATVRAPKSPTPEGEDRSNDYQS